MSKVSFTRMSTDSEVGDADESVMKGKIADTLWHKRFALTSTFVIK